MAVRTKKEPPESTASFGPAPEKGAAIILAIGCLLVFLDALAITWYLWKLPESSLDHLDKTLRTAGGWVTAAASFLGIRHTLKKTRGWQLAAGLIVLAVTALVWFLLLPVHSLHLMVTDEVGGPLAQATATIAGENLPRGAGSGPSGSLVISSLAAAKYDVVVARDGYVSQHRIFPFLDVVRLGAAVPLKLEREINVLVVSSKPAGASIAVDKEDRPRGVTPSEIDLVSGGHRIKLALAGCQPLEFFIRTQGGERRTEQKELICKKLSWLRVETRQDGVDIIIDGVDKGGPLRTQLPAGEHKIVARLDGKTQTKTVRIPEQSVVTFDMGRQP